MKNGLLVFFLMIGFVKISHAGIGLGIQFGGTYKTGDPSSSSYSGAFTFPAFGIHAFAKGRNFGMKNYVDYSTFAQKYNYSGGSVTVDNNIFSWLGFACFYWGGLYLGPGGGVGFERFNNTRIGYPFFGGIVGYDVTKLLGFEIRVLSNIGHFNGMFKDLYFMGTASFRVFQGND